MPGSPLHYDAVIETANWTNSLTRMERQMLGLTSTVTKQSNLIDQQFARIGQLAAGYLSFQTLASLPAQIVKVRSEFQSLEIAFTTMLRSKTKADALLTEVVQAAGETPFGLKDIAAGAKQLLAYGSSAQNVVGEIRMLGDVAAGVSVPIGDLIYLYGTLRSQGRAYAVDIRQFAGRGIPIYQSLADVLGVSVDKVNDFVSAGKVGFKEVEQAFKAMTSTGGLFNGTLEAQSKSLNGLKERLGDAFDVMLNDIGKANEGIIASGLTGATSLVQNYQDVIDILKVAVGTYGAYKTAIIVASVAQQASTVFLETYKVQQSLATLAGEALTVSQLRQATAATLLSRAQAALNSTMLANPAILLATAIAGLTVAYFTYHDEIDEVKTAQQLLVTSADEVSGKLQKQSEEIRTLVDVIQNQNVAESERLKAYEKLNGIAPDILKGLDFQAAKTANLTKVTNEYLVSLRQRHALEINDSATKKAYDQDAEAAKRVKKAEDDLIAARKKGDVSLIIGTGPDARGPARSSTLDAAKKELDRALAYKKQTEKVVADSEANYTRALTGVGQKDTIEANIRRQEQVMALLDKLSPAYKAAEDQIAGYRRELKALADAEKQGQVVKAKTVEQIDDEIKKLKEQQAQQSDPTAYNKIKAQIDALDSQRRRITGELTKEQKKAAKDADKIGPFGSLSYYDNIIKKADEALQKLPATDTAKIAQQNKIKLDAEAKAEAIRKQLAVKSFGEELEEKKKQYELFQKFVDTYGQAAADTQFGELKKSGVDYLAYLNRQIDLLETKKNAGKLGEKDATNLGTLIDERSALTGQKTAIELFKDGLAKARQEAASLADFLVTLKQKQAELNPNDNSSAGIEKRRTLADQTVETERELQGQLSQFLVSYASSGDQQLAIQKKYADLRAALDKRYNDKRGDDYKRALLGINESEKNEFAEYQRRKLEETQVYKDSLKVILEEGEKGRKIQIDRQKAVLNEAKRLYGENSEIVKQEQAKLNGILNQSNDPQGKNGFGKFVSYTNIIGQFGQALSELDGDAGRAGQTLVSLSQTGSQLSAIFKGGMSDTELYQAAISNAIQIFSAVTSAAAERKRVETDYYNSLIAQQQQYNLLLGEQIGLRTKSSANAFIRDYIGELNDGFAKYDNARAKYEESLRNLDKGRAKAGLRDEVDKNAALKLIGNGAATGAAIGAIAGPAGAAIGAAAGAVVGGLISLFGGAKKKADEFKGLLEQYPDLIKKGADGVEEINTQLAQSLIAQGLVDDTTKGLIQTTLDWQKQMDEAKEAIKGIVSELAGNLGSQLSDSLVDAFKNGEDAAQAFSGAVSWIMEQLVTKILFQQSFGKLFDQLQEDLAASLNTTDGGDGAVIDDFQRFTENSKGALAQYNEFLKLFQDASKSSGFDVLQNANGGSATKANTSLSGAVKGISESTADILSGQLNAIRITQADTNATVRQSLVHLSEIATNSRILRTIDRSLESIDNGIRELNRDPMRAKGG
jgi:tape measure domain-containing protein